MLTRCMLDFDLQPYVATLEQEQSLKHPDERFFIGRTERNRRKDFVKKGLGTTSAVFLVVFLPDQRATAVAIVARVVPVTGSITKSSLSSLSCLRTIKSLQHHHRHPPHANSR